MNQLDRVRLMGEIAFNEAGLVPAIAQDVATGRVLMMAWMNEEAFRQTLDTGFAHYFSRSRKVQWKKGETSGHVQKVVEMYLDCDGDTLLIQVEQTGAACHEGYRSCFFRAASPRGDVEVVEKRLVDPATIYPKRPNG